MYDWIIDIIHYETGERLKSKKTSRKRKQKIPKVLKDQVWEYTNGEKGTAKCYVCNHTKIKMNNFTCGHIIPESKGGKMEVNNLKPICSKCNLQMGTQNLEEFKKIHYPSKNIFVKIKSSLKK